MNETARIEVGDKIYIASEKRPYRVRAANQRFAVCTKPHFKTVLWWVSRCRFVV